MRGKRVVSFFAGAGGLDLGFMLAGHRVVWANDYDKDAVETYNNNIGKLTGHESICGDIKEMLDCSREEIDRKLPDSEVIIGGFPCQGFTIANNSRSMKDERNYLYVELLKAIAVKQPEYFVLENVKGLESMEKGKVLEMILDELELAGTVECKVYRGEGKGYKVVYNVLNALDYGVPQNRERVIILGVREDKVEEYEKEHPGVIGKGVTRKVLNVEKTHTREGEVYKGETSTEVVNGLYEVLLGGKEVVEEDKGEEELYRYENLARGLRGLSYDFSEDSEEDNIYNHRGSKRKVTINNRVGNRETYWDKYAPTIMGRGSGTGGPILPPHPEKHRRLTVREAARIQTFPDSFKFYGSNTACYRQVGNAVPILLAYNIAKVL